MIAHAGKGIDSNSKALCEMEHALLQPVFTLLKVSF
jgi:hypothetical protein